MLLSLLVSTAFAGDPGTANFGGKGFTVADAAGKNVLNLGLSLQPRFTTTLSGDPDATDEDAMSDTGLRIRRMLLTANGTLAGYVDYKFRIDAAKQFTFTDADGKTQQAAKAILDDAQVVFRANDAAQLSVGQWKVPFLTEQMASDTTLLFPERALPVDGVKYGDTKVAGYSYSRDAGVALLGSVADKKFEYQAGVFNGDGTNTWPTTDDGSLYVARVAVAPLGEFKYDEVDLERGKARLGVDAAVTLNNHPTYDDAGAAGDPTNDLRAAGGVRFAASGLSVNAEAIYGSVSSGDTSVNSLGFYAQAGYCLPIGIAPGARFARLDPAMDAEDDAVSTVEGVLNWYLPDPTKKGSNLGHKVQVQAAWTTALAESLDHPLYHQLNLAAAVGF